MKHKYIPQVFVVCDSDTVRSDSFLADFMDYLETNGEVDIN